MVGFYCRLFGVFFVLIRLRASSDQHACNNDLFVSIAWVIMIAACCFAAFLVTVFAQEHFFDYVSFCLDWVVIGPHFYFVLFVCYSHMVWIRFFQVWQWGDRACLVNDLIVAIPISEKAGQEVRLGLCFWLYVAESLRCDFCPEIGRGLSLDCSSVCRDASDDDWNKLVFDDFSLQRRVASCD